MEFNTNPDWLKKKASEEDGQFVAALGGPSITATVEDAVDGLDEPGRELVRAVLLRREDLHQTAQRLGLSYADAFKHYLQSQSVLLERLEGRWVFEAYAD